MILISELAPPVKARRPTRFASKKILSPATQQPDQKPLSAISAIENEVPCVYPRLPALELLMIAYNPPFKTGELFTPRHCESENLTCSKRGCLMRTSAELAL